MFWGLILQPGKKYSRTCDEDVVLTMASLGPADGKSEPDAAGALVMVNYEINKQTFVMASLRPGQTFQQRLSMRLTEGEHISIWCTGGNCPVHLTGYIKLKLASLGGELQDFEDDDSGSSDFESGEEDSEDDYDSDEDSDFDADKVEELPSSDDEDDGDNDDDGDDDDDDDDEATTAATAAAPKRAQKVEKQKKKDEKKRAAPESDEPAAKKAKKAKKAKQSGEDVLAEMYKKQEQNKAKEAVRKEAAAKDKADKAKVDAKKKPQPVKKKGGVTVTDLKVGDGVEARKGKRVGMYYRGWLESNKKQFDANLKGAPFTFKLGAGEVIKGWDIGVEGMRVGGKRRLSIPSNMGYGSRGAPPDIPGGARLGFDVECKRVS